jgi:hypothetical protein
MNTILRTLLSCLALFLLAGCIAIGIAMNQHDMDKINNLVRESVEKTFPLPEQAIIRTHIGDDVRFSTELSIEKVVVFYRETYDQIGFIEAAGSEAVADRTTILFKKDGEKDVLLEVTKNENGSEVHIRLQEPWH